MTGKTRQVIIGNSGAGLSALKAIRQMLTNWNLMKTSFRSAWSLLNYLK